MEKNNREPKKLTLCSRTSDILSRPREFAELVSEETAGVARKCAGGDYHALGTRSAAFGLLARLAVLDPNTVPAGVARSTADLASNVGVFPEDVREKCKLGDYDRTATEIDHNYSMKILGAIFVNMSTPSKKVRDEERAVYGADAGFMKTNVMLEIAKYNRRHGFNQ